MPRLPRRFQNGECHHVINRGNVRSRLFFDAADYQLFLDLLTRAAEKFDIGLLGYCLMPNHWHLVVIPGETSELSRTMHWLTSSHVHRWLKMHERNGPGHVYQGRFLSIPVQHGIHVCRILRYVERNALAAELVTRAEDWPWGSAHQRLNGNAGPVLQRQSFLPDDQWLEHVNSPHVDDEIAAAIRRNLPVGDASWVRARDEALGLRHGFRCGRPPKARV